MRQQATPQDARWPQLIVFLSLLCFIFYIFILFCLFLQKLVEEVIAKKLMQTLTEQKRSEAQGIPQMMQLQHELHKYITTCHDSWKRGRNPGGAQLTHKAAAQRRRKERVSDMNNWYNEAMAAVFAFTMSIALSLLLLLLLRQKMKERTEIIKRFSNQYHPNAQRVVACVDMISSDDEADEAEEKEEEEGVTSKLVKKRSPPWRSASGDELMRTSSKNPNQKSLYSVQHGKLPSPEFAKQLLDPHSLAELSPYVDEHWVQENYEELRNLVKKKQAASDETVSGNETLAVPKVKSEQTTREQSVRAGSSSSVAISTGSRQNEAKTEAVGVSSAKVSPLCDP